MTAVQQGSPARSLARWIPKVERVPRKSELSPTLFVLSYSLSILAAVLFLFLAQLMVVSQIQHFASQHKLYDQLRFTLADGSVPIGQTDINGQIVKPGTPIALLTIPELGVKEVVVEGTTSRQTRIGVGHRPDTPYPGQPGISVLMGRAAAYGGVFGKIKDLQAGQTFTVQTGQGTATYKVLGRRTADSKLPALDGKVGLLTLATATGGAFVPNGVLRVDAQLVTPAVPRPAVAFAPGTVPMSSDFLNGDPSRLNQLAWLAELLVIAVVGAVWAAKRWSGQAMWIVFAPVIAVTGFACADRVCDLLPNLL